MKTVTHCKLVVLFSLFLASIGLAHAQDAGGPYTADANTILLMHFDGDLTNHSALSGDGVPHGGGLSYSAATQPNLGQSLSLDNSGGSSYVTVPHNDNLNLTGDWTIEMWFNLNSLDAGLVDKQTLPWESNYNIHIEAPDGHMEARFYDANSNRYQISTPPGTIDLSTWYHVVFTNDAARSLLTLVIRDDDFSKLFEQNLSYPPGTLPATSGNEVTIGAAVVGKIDELRISNVVRNYAHEYDWETTSSDNFVFHYTKPELFSADLATALENKFEDLDYTIWAISQNIYLLDRTQKIKVFLYDTDEAYLGAPPEIRDWDIGFYRRGENELHIKVPSSTRQLKYFSNLEKAAISVLARYVMAKKRPGGAEPSKGMSFGFGLYESGYYPDVNLINNYLNANNNTFPSRSTFSNWNQLDVEVNVELSYTYVFASIFRYGYKSATISNGVSSGYAGNYKQIWYQIFRLFFLADIEDGRMTKYYDGDDFIIYSNSQEIADLIIVGLRWYADQFEEQYESRISHPLLVAAYASAETYNYVRRGNIDQVTGGGEALSHSLLMFSPEPEVDNLDTELNRIIAMYGSTMGHEFMHNVFAFLTETEMPPWLNEGAATGAGVKWVQGYGGINVHNFEFHHNYFWNDNSMYFPDLDKIFDLNSGFGYAMANSAFNFIRDNVTRDNLLQYMKNADDITLIGYSSVDEYQTHLYKTLYHQYMPSFLFNPHWNTGMTYSPGANYSFNWDGHYIDDLIIEYSVDRMSSWNQIADIPFSNGGISWTIPNSNNVILRFSDKKHPEISFTYQIRGDSPTYDTVLEITFENGAGNNIQNGNDGRVKGDVSFELRDGPNGRYALYDGQWDVISVKNYPMLSFSENWTMQGDFMIDNTTGIMNQKPVLLEKMSTKRWNYNYSISYNKNGQKHVFFEYQLENTATVELEIDDAGITEGTWYTFYFARSVDNNIVEARIYDQYGNILGSESRPIDGEGKVLTGAGDLYLGSGNFWDYDKCLQGGLDNIIISDTYYDELLSNSFGSRPVVSNIPDQTINEGNGFAPISLDNYVTDLDNVASQIAWSHSGSSELTVVIDGNRVATVAVPDAQWIGAETITFTATDPGGASADDTATFAVVTQNVSPVVTNTPSDIEMPIGGDVFVLDLSPVFTDADNDPLIYSATSSNDVVATVSVVNNTLTLTVATIGNATITITANDGRGGEAQTTFKVNVALAEAVERIEGEVPTEYALRQNYPNPFNPITTIQWAVPEAGHVTLRIFNMQGAEIATLTDESMPPGRYSVSWDATGHASGVYLYRLEAGDYVESKALTLIK